MNIVLQKNFPNKKVSKLINGRFQIMEAWLMKGQYYVFDHEQFDQVRDKGGSIVYHNSYSLAEASILSIKSKKNHKK